MADDADPAAALLAQLDGLAPNPVTGDGIYPPSVGVGAWLVRLCFLG